MNALEQGITRLLRSSITGEALTLPEGFDMEAAYPILRRHQILPAAYLGGINCGIEKNSPIMRKMFGDYCRCLAHGEAQLRETERICTAFDAAGVEYMPLKGMRLKALYPKPELRTMGDADILIRTGQYPQIRGIMEGLGYSEQCESDHEFVWHSPSLHLELHKRLIPAYNRDYFSYFGDGWRLAKSIRDGEHAMSPEDEFIYIFTHFAKHYRDGGIGCRHVLDIWVYLRQNPQLNSEYIDRELGKLCLATFYGNMRVLLKTWFEGAATEEKSEFITDYIFKSGSWGNREQHMVAAGTKNAELGGSVAMGKVRQAWGMLFPPLIIMRQKYRVLERMPLLLPIFWPVRWVSGLIFRRGNVREQAGRLTHVSSEAIRDYHDALNYVGLDFSFKE